MLHELSLVERGAVESSSFDCPHAEVKFFRDHVVIESPPTDKNDDGEILRTELPVEEAKLLLLE